MKLTRRGQVAALVGWGVLVAIAFLLVCTLFTLIPGGN